MSGRHAYPYEGPEVEIRALMHEEFSHFLADIEFRLAQSYDVQHRGETPVGWGGKVYAEDLSVMKHILTGYTITDHNPTTGAISWASVHMVFNGADHVITDGSTTDRYVWWDPAQPTVLLTNAVKPTLTGDMALVFINDGGTAIKALEASMPAAVADGAVDQGAIVLGAVGSGQIADGAVSSTKTDFYDSLVSSIQAANDLATAAKNAADGAITTYYQATPPWANGSTQPADVVGDLWFDTDTNQASRWDGTNWDLIEDNQIAVALGAAQDAQSTADGKITTYAAPFASPPTGTASVPLSPGDVWIVTDQDNRIRRRNATNDGWDDISLGATAIADGAITPGKTTFYTSLSSAVTNAQTDASNALTQADAAITTYYSSTFPWANGVSQGTDKNGDLFFDTDDQSTWRWNESTLAWEQIKDPGIASALGAAQGAQETADGKINTYYAASTAIPSAQAVGDLWVVTDQDNQVRRASTIGTSGWVSVTFGAQAIATGGVSATNLNIFQHLLY